MKSCRFIFLIIFLQSKNSYSSSSSDISCGDLHTGNCTKNELPRAESLDIISWTCQGKFGIIRLNCSCIETNSTSQASQACCDAQITENGDREEIHQGVPCILSCTPCGNKSRSVESVDSWQCQWNGFRLVLDVQGRMQFHTRCNARSLPLATHDCDGKIYQKNRKKYFDQTSTGDQVHISLQLFRLSPWSLLCHVLSPWLTPRQHRKTLQFISVVTRFFVNRGLSSPFQLVLNL